ncbi:MAG: hypothetical protein KAW12_30660 [Candidatus Aminicenantes bacterium]|nr:hypothetical protein [Candidatus Aminicenantes bacterium]
MHHSSILQETGKYCNTKSAAAIKNLAPEAAGEIEWGLAKKKKISQREKNRKGKTVDKSGNKYYSIA